MRRLGDLDVQVAGRAAAGADLALAGQLDAGAVVDTGRDLDGERTAGAHPAVAGALGARGRHDGAETLALRARPRGHDLAQEGPGDLRHLALAAAHVTGLRRGAGRRALTRTGRTGDGRVDLEFLGGAERGLLQGDLQADHGVLAAPGARAGPALAGGGAEEGVHDVGEAEAGRARAEAARATAVRGEGIAAEVVDLALGRVGEHLVSGVDLLEPLLRLRVRVDVRVQFTGEAPERLLDLVLPRIPSDAEYRVVVRGHQMLRLFRL